MAMTTPRTHHTLSTCIALFILSGAGAGGITIDLIHRDSPRSPFYSNATSHVDKLHAAVQRSILRSRELKRWARLSPAEAATAPVHPIVSEYVVEVGIGTPPSPLLAVIDTGSDLTWLQCKPCDACSPQTTPLFDPAGSTTYSAQACSSEACGKLPASSRGCSAQNTCTYTQHYRDKSWTTGDIASETLTIGYPSAETASTPEFTFGCSHQNTLPVAGLFGLGRGQFSYPAQTILTPLGGKFAYCLIPYAGDSTVQSKIKFGDDAALSGPGTASTPVITDDTFYTVTLNGVTVGGQTQAPLVTARAGSGPARNTSNVKNQGYNVVFDSGTTLTVLPGAVFDGLVADLKSQVAAQPVDNPRAGSTLQPCYEGDVGIPKITFHFEGADLGLPFKNTFMSVTDEVKCLAMSPAGSDGLAIFGNLAQMDFIVSYDMNAKTIAFKALDCTSYT